LKEFEELLLNDILFQVQNQTLAKEKLEMEREWWQTVHEIMEK